MDKFCFIGAAMNPSPYDSRGRRKYLNGSENQKFLQAAESLSVHEAVFCLTIYYTGCRISEALSLTGDDIDLETSVLMIRTLKKRRWSHRRRVPIPESLANQLAKLAPVNRGDKLWRFSRTTGWRIVKRVMNDAGIAGVQATAKGLRHGFGVRGALNQIPLTTIRNWMGHSNVNTTAIYLDVRDEEERELIRRTW